MATGRGGVRPRWWRSVRARITAAVVVLTALGMTGAGVAAFLVELQRTDQRVSDAVSDELAELQRARTDGLDPQTGKPFTSIKQLMIFMLASDAPDENEILIAWWDDGPQKQQSPDDLAERLTADATFTDRVRELIATGGGTETTETVLGEALVAVQPLRDDSREGALVITYLSGAEREEVLGAARIYAVVSLLALLAVTLGAWSVAGRLLRPVRELTSTARDISDTDLSRRIPVDGNDDLTDLVRTFNAMLDRLEDAFATQRQFLDDAGHELRTPITVVRGHLELLDPDDHADVASDPRLLLDEIDRMGRLVDDLIVLAKAGRPDFVQLAPSRRRRAHRPGAGQGTRDSATATGSSTSGPRARCSLDPQRLTQALLQLAANAVRHTGRRRRRRDRLAAGRPPAAAAGSATPGRGRSRSDRRRGSSSASCAAATPRPVRAPGSGSRSSRHRRGARLERCSVESRAGPGRDVHPDPARRAPTAAEHGGREHEPHPDRRGRGPHRGVRREGAAGQRAHADRRRRRRRPRSATRCPASSTWSCSTSGCRAWTGSPCCDGCGSRAARSR